MCSSSPPSSRLLTPPSTSTRSKRERKPVKHFGTVVDSDTIEHSDGDEVEEDDGDESYGKVGKRRDGEQEAEEEEEEGSEIEVMADHGDEEGSEDDEKPKKKVKKAKEAKVTKEKKTPVKPVAKAKPAKIGVTKVKVESKDTPKKTPSKIDIAIKKPTTLPTKTKAVRRIPTPDDDEDEKEESKAESDHDEGNDKEEESYKGETIVPSPTKKPKPSLVKPVAKSTPPASGSKAKGNKISLAPAKSRAESSPTPTPKAKTGSSTSVVLARKTTPAKSSPLVKVAKKEDEGKKEVKVKSKTAGVDVKVKKETPVKETKPKVSPKKEQKPVKEEDDSEEEVEERGGEEEVDDDENEAESVDVMVTPKKAKSKKVLEVEIVSRTPTKSKLDKVAPTSVKGQKVELESPRIILGEDVEEGEESQLAISAQIGSADSEIDNTSEVDPEDEDMPSASQTNSEAGGQVPESDLKMDADENEDAFSLPVATQAGSKAGDLQTPKRKHSGDSSTSSSPKKKPAPAEKVAPAGRLAILDALTASSYTKNLIFKPTATADQKQLSRHWREVLSAYLRSYWSGKSSRAGSGGGGKGKIDGNARKFIWKVVCDGYEKADWNGVLQKYEKEEGETDMTLTKLKRHFRDVMRKEGEKVCAK